jgi:hypothetical protein
MRRAHGEVEHANDWDVGTMDGEVTAADGEHG